VSLISASVANLKNPKASRLEEKGTAPFVTQGALTGAPFSRYPGSCFRGGPERSGPRGARPEGLALTARTGARLSEAGKGGGFWLFSLRRGFQRRIKREALHVAARGGGRLRLHNSALSEAGGFSDAPQRGALPAFDNVALCKSRSTFRRAASMLPQALLNSGGSSGRHCSRYRRVACTE
jgi:hypothetical protein